MAEKYRPLEDRIVVRPIEIERTKSGLYVPDVAKQRPQRGVVLATGPGRYDHGTFVATSIAVGDVVLYGKYAGVGIEDPDDPEKELLVLRESDVLCVVKED